MTNNQYQDVADLITEAFAAQSESDGLPSGRAAQKLEARSRLKVNAAQAVGTLLLAQEVRTVALLLAQEVRTVALLLAAGVTPASGNKVNPDLLDAAFVAAANHLGLVEEPEEQTPAEEFAEFIKSANLEDPPAQPEGGGHMSAEEVIAILTESWTKPAEFVTSAQLDRDPADQDVDL